MPLRLGAQALVIVDRAQPRRRSRRANELIHSALLDAAEVRRSRRDRADYATPTGMAGFPACRCRPRR
jgi:hypothetical protein